MNYSNIRNIIGKLPTPYILILVGPPLCGKSTFIKKLSLDNVTIISRDAIVLEQYGYNDYSAAFNSVNQKQVDKILVSRLEDANANKENVIIDMTNLTTKRRSYNLSFFNDDYYKVAVIFPFLEWNEFVSRNEKRKIEENKFIPEYVIKNMMGSFTPIKDSEGFNKVISL
jgi:predicted kinase